jgi:hypothetical protein
MPQRRRLTVLAAVLALAAAGPAPVPALAQSAGDDQYEDPFAGEDPGDSQQEPQAPAAEPAAPAQSTPAPDSSTPTAPAAEPASQPQPELPRTGLDAAPVLAIGAVLLGGGMALRVRMRERS